MNDGTWYRTGTVSLTNGADLVDGYGTAFIDNVFVGGIFFSPSGLHEITRVISDTQLQLVVPYAGPTVVGAEFAVAPTQGAVVAATKQLQSILQTLGPLMLAWQSGELNPKGLALKGVKNTVGDLPASGNMQGDGWVVDQNLWVWTGTTWYDAGPIGVTEEMQQLRDDTLQAKVVVLGIAGQVGDLAGAVVQAQQAAAAAVPAAAVANTAFAGAVAAAESVGSFTTKALADAKLAAAGIPLDKGVYVTADALDAKNGFWVNRAGVLVLESKATLPALSAAVDALQYQVPTIGLWSDLTVDSTGRPVRGEMKDGTRWEARSGVLVQISRAPVQTGSTAVYDSLKVTSLDAPGVSLSVPTIGAWTDLVLDATGHPVRGQKFDGTMWEVRQGVWVQIQAPLGALPSLSVGAMQATTLTVTDSIAGPGIGTPVPTIGMWRELAIDATGRPVYGLTHDGRQFEARAGAMVDITPASAVVPAVVHGFSYDFNTGTAFINDADTDYLIMINGQSWAQGGKAGDTDDATVTTVAQHPGAALMMNPGVRPGGAGGTMYMDLREQDMGGSYETAASGMADVIMTNLQARLGFKPRIVFTSATYGGQAYWDATNAGSGLKRGTATYAEGIRLVQRATAISKAAGRKLIVLAQVVIHGEQDYTNGTPLALYQRALDQWQAHFDQDARTITGQADPVRMYVTQVNRGGGTIGSPALPALAQLAAEDRNPRIRCCGPVYQAPSGLDGSHLRALGYRMIGRQVGKFILEDMFGPYEQPLRVIDSYWISGTVVRLKFSKPLSIETTNALINVTGVGSFVGLGPGKGIDFTDGSATPVTVTAVAAASGTTDAVNVTLSGAPTGKNPRLTIAAYRPGYTGSGATNGARSAIRSATSIDTDSLTGVTQYHWACQEQIVLPLFA
ncbi:hypothetical protein BH10PSE18_BH10PSE18_19160 [soil metagenome]